LHAVFNISAIRDADAHIRRYLLA